MVQFQPVTLEDVPLFFTLILLELVLSFDNAAILAALSNRLPPAQRRKALLYGLAGAYVFRIAAILGVVVILENEWLKLVGAAYLIYLSLRHVLERGHEQATGRRRTPPKIIGISLFWSTVVYIELADVAFALDQILVAVALTEDVIVIIAAACVAIIFLRLAAFYIGRVMEWFPPLETLAYIAVGFVGVKMVLAYDFPGRAWHPYHVPTEVSIAITLSLIVLPPLGKYVLEKLRGKPTPGTNAPPVTETVVEAKEPAPSADPDDKPRA